MGGGKRGGQGGGTVRRGPLREKGEGGAAGMGVEESNGGALCVVDYRLVHGRVDAREAVWGRGYWEGTGGGIAPENRLEGAGAGRQGAAGQGRWREEGGRWYRLWRITLRKGAAGWTGGRARRGKGDCGKGAGGGIASENHFEEGGRGVDGRQGAAGQERWREGAGGGIALGESLGRTGARGARARRETTRRKKCRAKRKRRPGPPYLWYLEFCKIWKPR